MLVAVAVVEIPVHLPALRALVERVVAVLAEIKVLLQHLEPQILAEAVVVVVAQLEVLVALGLLLFVMPMDLEPLEAQQVLQLSQYQVDTVYIHLRLLGQLHSEAQHGTFCKSRKRRSHTSYCGWTGRH
jgi:hypothetical protein